MSLYKHNNATDLELDYKHSRKIKQSIFNSDDAALFKYNGTNYNYYIDTRTKLSTETLPSDTHVYVTEVDSCNIKGQKYNDVLIDYFEKNCVDKKVNTKKSRYDHSTNALTFEYIVPVTKILPKLLDRKSI
uniref:Uncharacterized protein n=1 Tax=viral metagenome TaxID=1070528 RepID=A0A6C0EDQ6_9ZZZZ